MANSIIRGLRAVGVVVWWDEDMRSIDWHQELERQIVELAAIVVLWTPSSSGSDHVKDEARLGLESNKLINVIVGLPKPPFPYDRVNGLPLDGWTEREPNRGWTRLIETIEEKVVEKGGAKPGELTGALARREESLKLKQQALARAQEALEEAKAREAETIDAAQIAQATFVRAEEQHLRVMEMRATHLIMSAAAQEYEAARAAKEDADRALRAAKAEIKGVAREVALAIAALESQDAAAPQRRTKAAEPALSTAEPEIAPAPPPPAPPPPAAKAPDPEPAAPAPAIEPPKPAPAPKAAEPAPIAQAPVAQAPVAQAPVTPAPAAQTPAAAAAAAASPAPAAVTSAPAPSSGNPMLLPIIIGAVVLLGVIAAGAFFVLKPHPKPVGGPVSSAVVATTTAPMTAPAAGAPKAPPAADPTAAAVAAAAPLSGKWALQGLSCDSPIVIAVQNGAVSMTVSGATSTATIQPSPVAGVTNAKGSDGAYVYKLGPDGSLSMVDPTNQTMKMTKCAG